MSIREHRPYSERPSFTMRWICWLSACALVWKTWQIGGPLEWVVLVPIVMLGAIVGWAVGKR